MLVRVGETSCVCSLGCAELICACSYTEIIVSNHTGDEIHCGAQPRLRPYLRVTSHVDYCEKRSEQVGVANSDATARVEQR